MAIIKWKEVYQTGIVALDNEHQQLVEQINTLFEAVRHKRSEAVLAQTLEMLWQYTESHFAHEEQLLREHGYPGLAEHQQNHQNLREAVEELKKRSHDDPEKLAKELLTFLRKWLLEHIVEVDKKYGSYLEMRGGRFIS